MIVFINASFPPGKWSLNYDVHKDTYIIKTEYGTIIGEIHNTLVAHWLVKMYNAAF